MEFTMKIDTFKLEERILKEGGCDIKIIFMSDGKNFTEKEYKNLEWRTVKEVKDMLFDLTLHNLNEEQISRCIPFSTILHEIENVIFKK